MSLSGATVAIGAPFNDHNGEDLGHVRVHQLNSDGSSWEQLGSDFDGYEKMISLGLLWLSRLMERL